jgi:hypothetical protein
MKAWQLAKKTGIESRQRRKRNNGARRNGENGSVENHGVSHENGINIASGSVAAWRSNRKKMAACDGSISISISINRESESNNEKRNGAENRKAKTAKSGMAAWRVKWQPSKNNGGSNISISL